MTKAITKNSKKGFTLVELVVVIAILAILAAIAIPVVSTIISTASKNAALTDAQTIELAIKEAQADYVAKNPDTYPGIKNSVKPSINDVMTAKKIEAAFESKIVDGKEYTPYWIKADEKVIFVATDGSNKVDVEGETVTITTNDVQLATTNASGAVSCTTKEVVSWGTASGSALSSSTGTTTATTAG